MGKVSFHFFTCLFNAFLIYIVLINFTGWSGAWIDLIGQTSNKGWSNSYFGFQSIQMMLSEANDLFNTTHFSIESLLTDLNSLSYVITFGLPHLISTVVDGDFAVLDLLHLIVNLLIQPFALAYFILKIFFYLISWAIFLLSLLMRMFAGEFNIPFDNIPDYHPSSLVIPPVFAFGFML